MKASSLIALICSLLINGLNALDQPAVADQLTRSGQIAEAPASPKSSANNPDALVVTQIGDKYGC
jgi:hypothetical protein